MKNWSDLSSKVQAKICECRNLEFNTFAFHLPQVVHWKQTHFDNFVSKVTSNLQNLQNLSWSKPIRFTVSLHWIFQLLMNRAHILPKKREKIFEISYPPNNTQSSCPSNITHLKQTHLDIFNFKGNINFPKKWAWKFDQNQHKKQ